MLKAAGWVIGDEAARVWLKKHPDISIPEGIPFFTPYLTLRYFLRRREAANEQLPFKSSHLDTLQYPKVTCLFLIVLRRLRDILFMSRLHRKNSAKRNACSFAGYTVQAGKETWKDYEEVFVRPEDEELRSWLEKDGLTVGEWITVPDPWDADWPFAKRHPGKDVRRIPSL